MLRIDCPWCGPRDEPEFVNGGEAHGVRPTGDDIGEQTWADYLFDHANPKGPLAERWLHLYGCGRWFHALRDTLTHEIQATWRLDAPGPTP